MQDTLELAFFGGLVAAIGTGIGALLGTYSKSQAGFLGAKPSAIDFALGLMFSAVGFSLVGPLAREAWSESFKIQLVGLGLYFGVLLVFILRKQISKRTRSLDRSRTHHIHLVAVLLAHNFPEGLASGASVIGMSLASGASLLGAIALQNIPEGLLMVVSLRAIGLSASKALWGGLLSAGVELAGGVLAGIWTQGAQQILPFLLSLAGGAMFTSAMMELLDSQSPKERIWNLRFAGGFLSIPLLNLLVL